MGLEVVMETINNVIAAFVAACTLIAALSPLILELLKRIKDERVRKLVEDAVAFAEQVSKNHEKVANQKMPSMEKYNLALSKTKELVPGLNEEKSKLLIESILGRVTMGVNGKEGG
jgi:uncharacterized membrane protein